MRARSLAAVAWVVVFFSVAPAAPQDRASPVVLERPPGWRLRPAISLGYDSFGQSYTVTDDDTLDLQDEFAARLHTSLEREGRTRLRLQNTFGYGQEATRNDLVARLERPWRTFDVRAEQEVRYKAYAPGSDFTYSSDYVVGTTRASGTWHLRQDWRLRLDERFEWAWFEHRDRYNYRYRLNDTGLQLERSYGILSRLRGGYSHARRSVPDSSAIDYRRHVAVLDWDHEIGLHSFGFAHRLERRRFGDSRVRSHFWDYSGETSGTAALADRVRLRPVYRGVVTHYDLPDSIWSNSTEQSAELLVETDVSSNTVLALGPRGEFRRTGDSVDRAYNQWGLKGSVTFSLGSTLWLQFTDEVGQRRYLAGDDLLFSDYTFNWSTLYLTWQPRRTLGFDLFFSLNPETHEDDVNDTTTLLLSTSVTYGWR
jgi:hypothetical protein